MDQIQNIKLEDIKVGEYEQRYTTDDLDTIELSKSIERIGIIEPLVVIDRNGELHLIAGHRRYLAARMAGYHEVPCIVRISKREVDAEITFAENFFSKKLSPVELAAALKDCYEREIMTVAEIAAGFHRTEHWVNSMIAISGWPDEILEAIHNEKISVSAAGNLACIIEPEYRAFLVRNAVESGATARTTAAWLQAYQAMQPAEEALKAPPVPAGTLQAPLVPQAPCLCCAQQFPVNMMSHVPVCGGCIPVIRQVGMQLNTLTPDQPGPQGPDKAL